MGTKLYVGGLPYAATESQLSNLFSTHGTVESARVITDKFTGQSRGFGFVEMSTAEEAKAAITALNGSDMDGRQLTVNEANELQLAAAARELDAAHAARVELEKQLEKLKTVRSKPR